MRTYSLYCKEKINSLDIRMNEEMLAMRHRKAITAETRKRCVKATKKEKILNNW